MIDKNDLNHNEGLEGNGDQPVSIPEIAKKLENGELDPARLSKKVRNLCVAYFKLQKYPDVLIGDIVGRSDRSIRRYNRENKIKNLLGTATQDDYVSCLLISWKSQKLRVLKEIYSKTLKPLELIRALGLVHMIERNEFDLLERLGYFREVQIEAEIVEKESGPKLPSAVKTEVPQNPVDLEFMAFLDKLDPNQRERVRNFMVLQEDKIIKEAKQMAQNIINEVEQREKMGKKDDNTSPDVQR